MFCFINGGLTGLPGIPISPFMPAAPYAPYSSTESEGNVTYDINTVIYLKQIIYIKYTHRWSNRSRRSPLSLEKATTIKA